jgi:hypothetical protein
MFSPVTPFLAGKLDGQRGVYRCPYEAGSQAAKDYDAGWHRGMAS